jgi:hypothetical protein
MFARFLRRRGWLLAAAVLTAAVVVPVAWAASWVNVGQAQIRLNEQPSKDVITDQPRYQDEMRLYVTGHSPCGGNNFWMEYLYPDLTLYDISSFREICTGAETPSVWNQNGGNKYAACGELNNEPTDPTSTCQRHSTTS